MKRRHPRPSLTSDRAALVAAYVQLVRRHAPSGIVSRRDVGRFEGRHVHDCLRAAPLLESLPPGPCVDVGSGAGLPGVPLAIADPARRWRLLEPKRTRAAFLEEVVRVLDLDCEVIRATAEDAGRDPKLAGAHVLATARALAPPPRAFELLGPLVVAGGVALVFAGEGTRVPAEAEEFDRGILIIRPRTGGRDARDTKNRK